MKLNLGERLITGNPIRAFVQRHVEAPMLKGMALYAAYPVCLEIGCGSGAGAEAIAKRFGAGKVIATDIDPAQIARARKRLRPELAGTIEFKVDDAMALDQPSCFFDAVFSFGVIHHTEDWRKAIGEAARVLKPGGEFFFEEPLMPFVKLFIKGGALSFIAEHPEGGMFDFEEFKEELEKYGIEITGLKRLANIAVFGVGRKK